MAGPMFDLEGCDDAVLVNNKTTSEQFIKARNCPRIHLEGNEAGLNTLSESGIPVESLSQEQLDVIVSEIFTNEGKFSAKGNDWLSNTATFTTLAADVKSTIIGALIASGISCYKKLRTLKD